MFKFHGQVIYAMANIVLTYGYHPSETSVTQELAFRLQQRLASKAYSNDVVIFKIPYAWTMNAILSRLGTHHYKDTEYNDVRNTYAVAQKVKEMFPGSIIIDLHCAPDEMQLKPSYTQKKGINLKKIKNWQITDPIQGHRAQLEIFKGYGGSGHYTIEIPARYRPMKQKLFPDVSDDDIYLAREADFEASKAFNYLNPEVIGKVAHLVDTTVNTDLGVYRKPRNYPHRYRREGGKQRWGSIQRRKGEKESFIAGHVPSPPAEIVRKARLDRKLERARRIKLSCR